MICSSRPDTPAPWRAEVGKLLADERKGPALPTIELEVKWRDGLVVPVELSLSAKSGPHGWIGNAILRDLRERRRAEKELQESKSRYRSLFGGVPVGLYQTTPAGQFLEVNPAMVWILGYPDREALLAVKATDLYVNPEEHRCYQAALEQDGIVRHFEVRFRRPDGEVIWVEGNARAVRDADGQLLYYEGALQDISVRKRAEEALRESEEKFSKIFRNSPDAIGLISLMNGKIVEATKAFFHISGYTFDEAIGRTTTELNLWANPSEREQFVGLLQTQGRVINREGDFRLKSGEIRTGLLSGEVVEVEGKKYIGVIIRDITERRRAEEELRASREQLRALTARLAEAEETERRRLARELHDQVGQNLTALNLNLKILETQLPREVTAKLSARLTDSAKLLEGTIAQVRGIMVELRPSWMTTASSPPCVGTASSSRPGPAWL